MDDVLNISSDLEIKKIFRKQKEIRPKFKLETNKADKFNSSESSLDEIDSKQFNTKNMITNSKEKKVYQLIFIYLSQCLF